MKSLVVYYSNSGNTELIAKGIARCLNADLRKVEEVRKRSILGYLWGAICARRGKSSRIKSMDFNLDEYDLIFLGTPVWAARPTPAINAFVSRANFKNKKVVVFVTMAATGDKSTIKAIDERVKTKGGEVINSFAFNTVQLMVMFIPVKFIKKEMLIKKGEEIGTQYKR